MRTAAGSARSRAGGLLVFVLGVIACPAGLGIAVPFVRRGVLRWPTYFGVVLLVGGLALLCAGAARSVRTAPGWARAPLVVVLLVTGAVGFLPVGQAVAATVVPPTAVGPLAPDDYGLPFRDVEFRTTDGVRLSGWYLPSAQGAAVVLLHGAGSTRSEVLAHAVVLAGYGYGVLLFDARGHGRSGGRAMDFGWYGDEDVTAAVSFLQTRPDVDDERIAAVGLSMGGEEAIGAAAADHRIRAVVAEGATNRVHGDRAWLPEVYGWRGRLQRVSDRLTSAITDLLTPAGPPITLHDAVAATPCPVLLIAGGAVPDETSAARYIQAGSPSTVSLWVAPDAGHTEALVRRTFDWTRRTTDFLAIALRPATS